MADDFIDDEAQKFLGKIGVELRFRSQSAQARNLVGFARRVSRRQFEFGFQSPDRLRHLEPFGEHRDQRRVYIVDALAITAQLVIHLYPFRVLIRSAMAMLLIVARAIVVFAAPRKRESICKDAHCSAQGANERDNPPFTDQ